MRRSRVAGGRAGFTLIELLLSLVLGASILLAGRAIFERVGDAAEVVARRSSGIDAERVQHDEIRRLLRNVEVPTDTGARFEGDDHHARFTSWCAGASVLPSRCVVTLVVDTNLWVSRDSGAFLASPGRGVRGFLRYLADVRGGGRWEGTWGEAPGLPLAVAVIFGADTAVLRVRPLE